MGDASVPAGAYTREVLDRLPPARLRAILANVRSEEPDVSAIAAKVAAGAVDAGFVYATDVLAAGGDLRAVRIPARLQPDVAYGVAVVEGSDDPALAREFVAGLLNGDGARELRRAGFLPPP
jgi:molybdate transport system substrate-binding protein